MNKNDVAGRKVVRPHDPGWKNNFTAEAALLNMCFGAAVLEIHHIGSTAIPDILAKPTIDVLIVAHAIHEIDSYADAMAKIGYEFRGEHGIPGRRYFKKQPAVSGIGFHLHIFESGSEHITHHLQFRDFLLLRPDIAQEYSALKQTLASPTGALVADYAERKADFVHGIQRLARIHFNEKGK